MEVAVADFGHDEGKTLKTEAPFIINEYYNDVKCRMKILSLLRYYFIFYSERERKISHSHKSTFLLRI